jgi:hypothetical protein
MSDYSTNLMDTLSVVQAGKETTVNQALDALSPGAYYGRRASTSSGNTWGYYGAKVLIGGVVTEINHGTLTMTLSATNYIEASRTTGAVTVNAAAFTAGSIPLYTVVCGSSAPTDWDDHRVWQASFAERLAKALSDANTTLSYAEARARIMDFSGTLTTTRDIIVPLSPKEWIVYNGTGQSLRFIGATGTGITVATTKRAIIYADGTNVVRVTADT